MICIYHNRDFDGICSAAIIREYSKDCKFTTWFIGWDYGDPIPEIPSHEVVIIVDISFDMKTMYKIAVKSASFVWIDHHKSAIDSWKKFNKEVSTFPKNTFTRLNDKLAACELTWHYFNTGNLIPKAVELLGRYDVWDNSDKERWEKEILPFQMGMKALCNNLETFPTNIFYNDYIEAVIEDGETILRYQKYLDEYKCRSTSFEIEFEGYKAICINENVPGSNVFNSIWNEDKYDIMILFAFTGSSWRISLYTTKDIDVSEICKKYGGGGHKGAAGFRIEDISTLINTNKKEVL